MKKSLIVLPLIFSSVNCFASDARSYVLIPNDINLAEVQYSSISTDKELANTAKIRNESDSVIFRYLRTFSFFDTMGAAYVMLPYTQNTGNYKIGSKGFTEKAQGFGDARLFFGIGIYNMPALSREKFSKYNKNGTRSACSMALNIPTGEYNQNNVFNIGSNQYSLKNECVVSYTKNRFIAEFITGFTAYGDNKKYYGGKTKTQENMYQSEVHLTYNITEKFWSGVDVFYQNGGEQSINGVSSKDKMNNTLIGLTSSYNIGKGQYVKFNYLKTVNSPQLAAKNNYAMLTFQQVW